MFDSSQSCKEEFSGFLSTPEDLIESDNELIGLSGFNSPIEKLFNISESDNNNLVRPLIPVVSSNSLSLSPSDTLFFEELLSDSTSLSNFFSHLTTPGKIASKPDQQEPVTIMSSITGSYKILDEMDSSLQMMEDEINIIGKDRVSAARENVQMWNNFLVFMDTVYNFPPEIRELPNVRKIRSSYDIWNDTTIGLEHLFDLSEVEPKSTSRVSCPRDPIHTRSKGSEGLVRPLN